MIEPTLFITVFLFVYVGGRIYLRHRYVKRRPDVEHAKRELHRAQERTRQKLAHHGS